MSTDRSWRTSTDPAAWTATLARLAETQRVLAAERGRLVVAGVVSAPLDTLASEIPGLLEDRELLRVGEAGGMTETDWSALRGHATELQEACRRPRGERRARQPGPRRPVGRPGHRRRDGPGHPRLVRRHHHPPVPGPGRVRRGRGRDAGLPRRLADGPLARRRRTTRSARLAWSSPCISRGRSGIGSCRVWSSRGRSIASSRPRSRTCSGRSNTVDARVAR